MAKPLWILAVAFILGCGSSGGGAGGDPAAAFAGTWTFNSGSIMPACTGATIAPVDLTGLSTVLTRKDGTHVGLVSTSGIVCNVTFNVSGSTATAASGQTCTLDVGNVGGLNVGTVTVSISSWTLSLSGDTLTSTMNGTASVVIVSCTPTSSGTLSRSGGTDAG